MTHSHQPLTVFQKLKTLVLLGVIFLTPFFFLTTTQEYYVTNKFYLLAVAALLLLAISTIEFIITKKIVWVKRPLDNAVSLFALAVGVSTLLVSPNKIQALLNPTFGFVVVSSLAVLYYYISRNTSAKFEKLALGAIQLSTLLVGLVSIFFFFQPLKGANLPSSLAFLKQTGFTPVGSSLDLIVVLGFGFVVSVMGIILAKKTREAQTEEAKSRRIYSLVSAIVLFVGLLLTVFTVFKPFQATAQNNLLLPPFRLSWYGAVEILKTPLNAVFGVGVDNYPFLFTRVKDAAYNATAMWQLSSFSVASSTLLHIMSESGLLGLVSFVLFLFVAGKKNIVNLKQKAFSKVSPVVLGYLGLIIVALVLPPSFIIFFLLFVSASLLTRKDEENGPEAEPTVLDAGKLLPIYGIIAIVSVAFILSSGFGLYQTYMAEAYFKKSLDGYLANSAQDLYNNQRTAILYNPYIERFRINFAQTNLLIANNLAAKASTQTADGKTQQNQLSDQDKTTITNAIQAAISEAKAAVALNDQKSTNWDNLATIYRNVLNVAQGADSWTVTSYTRAITFDPQNPVYRLNLGGVYFSLKNYDDAIRMFEQAASLKPDWANAHYNLAWATYQKGDYQRSATEMQNVLYLLDQKKDAADYQKVAADLEEIKKKIPKAETQTQQQQPEAQAPQKLSLPTPPQATISPKLKLKEKEAQPPAPSPKEQAAEPTQP
ncbi:tetratricopeptide repeat protein [Candidatus Roizmanbacteria bacterium]|nr:tetratricopeptide repeat protein [Candidatus Roizmanbacteria bacterium]